MGGSWYGRSQNPCCPPLWWYWPCSLPSCQFSIVWFLLCHIGCVVFLTLAFLVSSFGILAIADWLMDRLYSLKYSLQDFITGWCFGTNCYGLVGKCRSQSKRQQINALRKPPRFATLNRTSKNGRWDTISFAKIKRHSLQISDRMKLRHHHSKGDSKPCPRKLYS